jgi:hypothetical protein
VTRVAWVLNLDADEELAHPQNYVPSPQVLARARAFAPRATDLLGPDDAVVEEGRRLEGELPVRAWCPTPRAHAVARRAGLELGPAPSLEVLRRVNDRRFSAELGQTLPGAAFAVALEEVCEVVAKAAPGGWLCKRSFGFSGTGQRRLRSGGLTEADRTWVEASFARGGLQVEPLCVLLAEVSLHGFVGNELVVGEPTVQECTPQGAWLRSVRAPEMALSSVERAALHTELERAFGALRAAGYSGPFGIDAYRYRLGDVVAFNPRGEVNARYSMGWAVGMGSRRPDRP